ncbi:MAG: AbrB/MazE/SpoVT family DNA-binding domain-containing protein [Anaerolineaceae bacterium]|nr:AbrB/MazE/SpoVT family DNA-binding domain-containing protein [Anaerolineaceae bacterium]
MQTKIQKWGNSLALRIPRSFALDASLKQNSVVEISLVDGKLVIKPVATATYQLGKLMARVNSGNIHREIKVGKPVGKENW